jgi:hypothetical protein
LSAPDISKEKIYFNITGNWYKGVVPAFYDKEDLEAAPVLEGHFAEIREEIIRFYSTNTKMFEPMYVPHQYEDKNWLVFNFYGFMLKYPENLQHFPKLAKVLEQIPNMVGAQISVLMPHTRIKAHISGSNALIRNHLGIVIPGGYPELGIRVKTEERCWEEGKVLAFTESHRHYAWNNTDKVRIVLLVDTIHPAFAHRKSYISAASLAVLVLKMFAVKFPISKKLPYWGILFLHRLFTLPFLFIFFLQNRLYIDVAGKLQKLKFKKGSS